jgi:DNA polymerase IV
VTNSRSTVTEPRSGRRLGDDGTRAILHVDMDAFYVSVELRRRPELRGQPVVVGGTGRRGVVAAASYEARRYGVHSAMPSVTAQRRCPHAVFLPGDHELYGAVSEQVHEIFHAFTPLIEPLALDEAFLDVTGALRSIGPAVEIAARIRRRVAEELELACSVGGASNKFIAKLASKAAKPRIIDGRVRDGAGVVLVPPGEELAFLHPLPVQALWGVGPATLDRLSRLGVRTVRDLADIGLASLVSAVGQAHGTHLHQLAWGVDDRPVESDRDAKSIGHEETFVHDRLSHDELYRDAVRLADGVASRLRAHGTGARTITLKLKFSDFTLITRSRTLPTPIATAQALLDAVDPLLRAVELPLGVRLLGISGSNFGEPAEQLSMDHLLAAGDEPGVAPPDWTTASGTIDAIRERFGAAAIGPASSVSVRGVRVVRTGAQQWGPDHDTPS